jgi:hypothetical protein
VLPSFESPFTQVWEGPRSKAQEGQPCAAVCYLSFEMREYSPNPVSDVIAYFSLHYYVHVPYDHLQNLERGHRDVPASSLCLEVREHLQSLLWQVESYCQANQSRAVLWIPRDRRSDIDTCSDRKPVVVVRKSKDNMVSVPWYGKSAEGPEGFQDRAWMSAAVEDASGTVVGWSASDLDMADYSCVVYSRCWSAACPGKIRDTS